MTIKLGDLIEEIGNTLANADDTDILKIRQIGHRLITMANGPARFLKHYTLEELQNMHNRKNYGEWN